MSAFQDAIEDYKYFLNKDYPQKALLKLVGDKYRLTREERNCLFRGVGKTTVSLSREKKIITYEKVSGTPLGIDWYNILITVDSYLRGFPLFISGDGILRDSSGVHGSFHMKKTTGRAIKEIITTVEKLNPEKTVIYLDSPVSHSGEMANLLREKCEHVLSKTYDIEVVPSADYFLKTFKGVVASSDSIVCDHAEKVFDLARFVLYTAYDFVPPQLWELRIGNQSPN